MVQGIFLPPLRESKRVQNSADKYDYDLFGREKFEYFPLQLGEGEYKISIFENITGNRYRQVKAQNVKAEIKIPWMFSEPLYRL